VAIDEFLSPAMDLGLARIRSLLARLGNPQLAARTVHVAGTNGKGSVCALLRASLVGAGFRVGAFTSPHFVHPRESVWINGDSLSLDSYEDTVARVRAAAAKAVTPEIEVEDAGLALEPTEFEVLTAVAFVAFRDAHVDYAVIETGLGGPYDATNVLEPSCVVITNLGMDHVEFLGPSIQDIARNEAAVVNNGGLVVIAPQSRSEEVMAPLLETLRNKRARSILTRPARWATNGAPWCECACPRRSELAAWQSGSTGQ
jgi:dihydrofolate synthase/folylpolyglutamate synthase